MQTAAEMVAAIGSSPSCSPIVRVPGHGRLRGSDARALWISPCVTDLVSKNQASNGLNGH